MLSCIPLKRKKTFLDSSYHIISLYFSAAKCLGRVIQIRRPQFLSSHSILSLILITLATALLCSSIFSLLLPDQAARFKVNPFSLLETLFSLDSRTPSQSPGFLLIYQLLLRLPCTVCFYPRHLHPRGTQSSVLGPLLYLHSSVTSSGLLILNTTYYVVCDSKMPCLSPIY